MTRKTVVDIRNLKKQKQIVCATSYTHPMACIADKYCDLILVGDSLGSTIYGMYSTVGVTIDMMIAHGRAVSDACKNACVVVDMPFATYSTPDKALENAAKIMIETNCDAVKMEGGASIFNIVEHLIRNGIPVMGHVGLMPQHIKSIGKYKYYGKTLDSERQIVDDVLALESAGVFSVVLECVLAEVANVVTRKSEIPTIGIGSSGLCDGQILVIDDLIGFSDAKMRFVKKFVNVKCEIDRALSMYKSEVELNEFCTTEMCLYRKAENKK